MADESPSIIQCRTYWTLAFRDVWKAHKSPSYFRGACAAVIAALLRWNFASAAFKSKDLIVLAVYAFAAYLALWIAELLIRWVLIFPVKTHDRLLKLEGLSKIKLSIENVRCQWLAGEGCKCSVTIRNLSETNAAENVSVRIDGNIADELGYNPGFNPFNEADLMPSSGHRMINPKGSADYLFPDAVNHLVLFFSLGDFRRFKKPQTFKIFVSSSTSPSIHDEYLIVESENGRLAIAKNFNSQS